MKTTNRTIAIEKENEVIQTLFDGEDYLEQNPDVAQAGVDPLEHYINHGYQEGRSPGDNFDADYYLSRNLDVAEAGVDPLEHYIIHGYQEERLPQNDFSIEIKYGDGTENFTPEMKQGVEIAAKTWENAIEQSTFEDGHTLEISILGDELEEEEFAGKIDSPLAQASYYPDLTDSQELDVNLPDGMELDDNENNLPIRGFVAVNIRDEKFQQFEEDPNEFADIMTHEFGHVMGIGGLWEENDLIDPITGVYRSDTNAGEAYNRLYDTDGENIPLSQREFFHWDENVFGNELMTPEAESSSEVSMPLSEITLGSLEDIGWNVFDDAAEPFPNSDTETALGFLDT